MQQLSSETMIRILDAEATYQALRAELAAAAEAREQALYAGWREVRDTRAVARDLPRTITAATVRTAVARQAPPADYEQLCMFE